MKSFEVKALGLEEVSANEAILINGGGWWKIAEKIAEYLGLADLIKEFCDGWNEAGDSLEFNWE